MFQYPHAYVGGKFNDITPFKDMIGLH